MTGLEIDYCPVMRGCESDEHCGWFEVFVLLAVVFADLVFFLVLSLSIVGPMKIRV